jgi:hypothetical protein
MWTYNSIRIFVTKISDDNTQIIAKLQPLNSKTIYQVFGYELPVYSVGGVIVGDTDKASLVALINDGVSYNLTGPEGSLGNYYLNKLSFDRIYTIAQTIRPDLDCTSPVYNFTMDLYKDA